MNFESINKALILAPHTDDGELGAGGTIAKLIDSGVQVYYAAFSTAKESVPDGYPEDILTSEVKAATLALGIPESNLFIYDYPVRKLNYFRQEILEELIVLRKKHHFDLVLLPAESDVHQDHATISQEGIRAFKNTRVLGYELIWNNLSFSATCFVKLQEEHLVRKTNALDQYQSQSGKEYMSSGFIYSQAKVRGVQIGYEYAECFEVIRWVME